MIFFLKYLYPVISYIFRVNKSGRIYEKHKYAICQKSAVCVLSHVFCLHEIQRNYNTNDGKHTQMYTKLLSEHACYMTAYSYVHVYRFQISPDSRCEFSWRDLTLELNNVNYIISPLIQSMFFLDCLHRLKCCCGFAQRMSSSCYISRLITQANKP